jgi:hypothetical protein
LVDAKEGVGRCFAILELETSDNASAKLLLTPFALLAVTPRLSCGFAGEVRVSARHPNGVRKSFRGSVYSIIMPSEPRKLFPTPKTTSNL